MKHQRKQQQQLHQQHLMLQTCFSHEEDNVI